MDVLGENLVCLVVKVVFLAAFCDYLKNNLLTRSPNRGRKAPITSRNIACIDTPFQATIFNDILQSYFHLAGDFFKCLLGVFVNLL